MKNTLSKLTFVDWVFIVNNILVLYYYTKLNVKMKQNTGYSPITYDEMLWTAAVIPLPIFRNFAFRCSNISSLE